ncbi:MAG: hypothetical protein GOVbin5978_52 [Prokaryotic dsDNA virus sp.]|nr:MAG: hypothetical protein GOVbin5978_52 [Prokaryotic dsDNA virus sp.]|tara:strand:- start:17896 stop:18243 length:348 start_codon:yes stop_codon:yes gene_type:complete
MATQVMTIVFELVSFDTLRQGGTVPYDPTTDTPLVRVYVKYKTGFFAVANISLNDVKDLTRNQAVLTGLASMADGSIPVSNITDNTITNIAFQSWTLRYRNSSLYPIFSAMSIRP